MKNILNVIADVLTLTAVCVAAIGHVLPWFNTANRVARQGMETNLSELQQFYATRSGIALGVLAGLIFLSLLIRWRPGIRRFLTLAMFASAFAALLFELLIYSDSMILIQDQWWHNNVRDGGFYLAMIPTGVAVFLCLVRMLWTMSPSRPVSPAALDVKPAVAHPPMESGFTERKP